MGKVKLCCKCDARPDGTWADTDQRFAVKMLLKHCIERGVTTDGRRVKEDPMNEVRVQAYLQSRR